MNISLCKSILLTIFLTISIFSALLAAPAYGVILDHIVINEYEQDPSGIDRNNEWVEIYNPTSVDVDIGGWKLSNKVGRNFVIADNTIIPANGYYVMTLSGIALSNRNEQLTLKDESDNEIDKTSITDDTDNDALTWQRFPNGIDTGADTDWKHQTQSKWLTNGGESITISLSQSSIPLGDQVTISGTVDPAHSTLVKIQTSFEGGAWTDLAVAETTVAGKFSLKWVPMVVGSYQVRGILSWDNNAVSNTPSLVVGKLSSQITLFVARNRTVDESFSIIGYIAPIKVGETVSITLIMPNGTILTSTETINSVGYFNYTFIPTEEGEWHVSASWAGDSTTSGATSSTEYFWIAGKREAIDFPIFSIALIILPIAVGIALAGALKGKKGPIFYPAKTIPGLEKSVSETPVRGPQKPVNCPICRQALTYDAKKHKWYCNRCKTFV